MGYTVTQAQDFINRIAPLIRTEATARGYRVCSTAIAQAIIEGAAGTSLLAKDYNNHFGMKANAAWKGKYVAMKTKEEYVQGVLTTITAKFRAYDSIEDGVRGYYDFINSKRYANLKMAANYVQYAQFIKADGWATSSSYVNTLTRTVEKYGLEKWDVIKLADYKIGNWYTLNANMNVRNEPSTKNENSILFVLPAGSRILCHDVIKKDGWVWLQLPPDPKNNKMYQYICADNGVKSYLKENKEV